MVPGAGEIIATQPTDVRGQGVIPPNAAPSRRVRKRQRLDAVFELQGFGLAEIELPSGRLCRVNRHLAMLLGCSPEKLMQCHLHEVLSPTDLTSVNELIAQLGPQESPATSIEIRLGLPGKASRWVTLSVAPLTVAPPHRRLLAAIHDVTARKEAETSLKRYHDSLEERVLERTAELDSANGALRDEILERSRAEAERRLLLNRLVTVQEDERRRISRELHDQVGQHIAALLLGLKSLRDEGGVTREETINDLQRLTEVIGKEIHDLALDLRPTALDDLGLLRTLENFVHDWSTRTRIAVDFHASGDRKSLPPEVETTLFRIVREAFTNVLRHAQARRVSVIVECRPDQATMIIEDDGRGFDPEAHNRTKPYRLGLVGMRERAAVVGGEFNIESGPGRGTTVFVRIPLGGGRR
jgi:PAS domain S-box-containing protein